MNRIRVAAPSFARDRREVSFSWTVEPATPLYRATSFVLRFPPELDLERVPESLWWTVALLCLHSHWNLLRPCRVELPVELPAGEAEFWRRLLEIELATLEAYRGAATPDGALPAAGGGAGGQSPALELVTGGPRLASPRRLPLGDRCAAAFSGGKDSLLQAGLLAELTAHPILVTTTSPLPPLADHRTARRRQVLAAIAARREVTVVEVESDLRASWRNDFPPLAGYPVAVNEITDTFLYFAALLVAGVALQAGHLFLASEAEVQDNVELPAGGIVQHPHFMYSNATQRAIAALLAPLGVRYGSLICALHSEQVQELLWTRYGDLADLQYSCWRVAEDEAACNRCSQCLRVALGALALRDLPQRMGIELTPLLSAMAGWQPRRARAGALPAERVAAALHAQVLRSIAATPARRVLAALALAEPGRLLDGGGWRALAAYVRLRRRLAAEPAPPARGFCAGFLRWLDPLVGQRLAAIYAEHFRPEPASAHVAVQARSEALTGYVAAPLAARSAEEERWGGGPGGPMIEEVELTAEELGPLAGLIPDPEPELALPCRRAAGAPERILPVADTLLDGNELLYLTECVRSNWISSAGRFVGEFEQSFARAVGCAHGVACASGTAALHLAVATLGIGPGDEVIVPTFTMIATANAVTYTGARPVLVDAEPETWNLDVAQVEARITPRTRAIVVVHTYGHPADMAPLLAVARRHRLAVIEDAAEAHGARYRGRPAGSLGDAAVFSFYGNKIVTTGEGGMVTTNDERIAAVVRRLRDHAFSADRHFWHKYLGFNYRMTNLQAAVGLAQTERFAELLAARRRNATRYHERLAPIAGRGLGLPVERADVSSAFWMYAILVENDFGCSRDELRRRLARQGIETRTFFIPIHLQPIYFRRHRGESFPVAESLCGKGMYLPSGPSLTAAEIDFIAAEVAGAAGQGS
ncbi:MAG TPA: aminotransferase class I/II-fold pyridoxal phosphate-dependent enzyme [Thermoanaerobaculia bacterium]|nr:aminotransferase class I/II-fold pyridoxal phosphate-dependent enzyme [Thermoanaerobaculia bacterium]